jgi:DMSO/TMAO reductase YedYZ molybdopterin-dependent catalytic subunit
MSTVAIPPGATAPPEPRIPPGQAAVGSLLAFAAALGVGHLVAGVVSPVSSPYQAVADAVVRLAPPALVELGKHVVLPGLPEGRADKFGLLLGVGLVVALVAVAAGLASRRRPTTGRRVLVVLGVLGLAAVISSPVFTLPDLVAPLAAMGAGLWTFRWLHEQAIGRAETLAAAEHGTGPDGAGHGAEGGGSDVGRLGGDGGDVGRLGGDGDRPGPSASSGWPGERRPGPDTGVSRRRLLTSSAAVGVGAVGAGAIGSLMGAGVDLAGSQAGVAGQLRPASPAPPIPPGADFVPAGTPTFLTANKDFYRIDTALRLPVKAAKDWSMSLRGMVERPVTLRYADLLRRPLVERTITLTCVSNEVGGNLISTANFVGVDLRDLLVEAGVRPGADQLFSTSLDGFTAGTPTEVVMEPDRGAMLALGMNGAPLPLEHGYPVRMVVPGLYGFVSATKWLADLELTTFDAKQAYWLQRGWAQEAPIKTESRIDKPRGFDTVPAGGFTAAGIAWAQHRGIIEVEVRIDGGPWQQAELAAEVGRDTWRMWKITLNLPPGDHFMECRAVDTTGQPQVEERASPIPDGASGWPSVRFTVD